MSTGTDRFAEPGAELEPLRIPITRTLIVAGAIASRDYQDVHHDAELAREKGSPDIFMNILTTNGLVGRYLTDQFPGATLRKVSIRLGVPNYPGDTMELTGRVTAVEGDTVHVQVVGANDLGKHVTGSVTLTRKPTPPWHQATGPRATTADDPTEGGAA
ncbi:acyl dehydratase [Streptomyces triticagri]|uniref:Acyl dehydratase n=1 Tax=Streptomyces triticagri TaxID=2293568 RepID=A0A372LW41_9ACTN|nr:MaoC family dehydratase [Streptomyces triticagri]RFU82896.1 acyl dehydratase [Streptomyces triticagri]